jgi:Caspase domain
MYVFIYYICRLNNDAMSEKPFDKNLAFLMGVANYMGQGIPALKNPNNDIALLAKVLSDQNFEVEIAPQDPDLAQMKAFFDKMVSDCQIKKARVVIYYAGHGIQADDSTGLKGYLVPKDAVLGTVATYFPMQEFDRILQQLVTEHVLLILDCCFAGTFRFSTQRDIVRMGAKKQPTTKQYYDMYIRAPSRKVLTSTSSRQKAFDHIEFADAYSPFAKAIERAFTDRAGADAGNRDQLVTITELASYLKDQLTLACAKTQNTQTVELGSLSGDDDGEFVFFLNGFDAKKLTSTQYKNPYKGNKPYELEDASVYFGREQAAKALLNQVKAHPFVVVTGASKSGKTSLVQAGLLPLMTAKPHLLIPSAKPPTVFTLTANGSFPQTDDWEFLFIDGWETLLEHPNQAVVINLYHQIRVWIQRKKKIIATVRADWEWKVREHIKNAWDITEIWETGRFLMPPFSQEDYHEIMVQPARRVGCTFEDRGLVETIQLDLQTQMSALLWLSLLLEALFEKIEENALRWQIKQVYYDQLGGMQGLVLDKANQVYKKLQDLDLKDEKSEQTAVDLMRCILLRTRALSVEDGTILSKPVLLRELDFGNDGLLKKVLDRLYEAHLIRWSTLETENLVQKKVITERFPQTDLERFDSIQSFYEMCRGIAELFRKHPYRFHIILFSIFVKEYRRIHWLKEILNFRLLFKIPLLVIYPRYLYWMFRLLLPSRAQLYGIYSKIMDHLHHISLMFLERCYQMGVSLYLLKKESMNPFTQALFDKAQVTSLHEPMLEMSHRHLLDWQPLKQWQNELGATNALLFQKIARDTTDYQNDGRSRKYLWESNIHLDASIELLNTSAPLNQVEKGFIKRSERIGNQNSRLMIGLLVVGLCYMAYASLGYVTGAVVLFVESRQLAHKQISVFLQDIENFHKADESAYIPIRKKACLELTVYDDLVRPFFKKYMTRVTPDSLRKRILPFYPQDTQYYSSPHSKIPKEIPKKECIRMMLLGDSLARERQFRQAMYKYEAARSCNPTLDNEIAHRIITLLERTQPILSINQ